MEDLEAARDAARMIHEGRIQRQRSRRDLKRLRKIWNQMSLEAQEQFLNLIIFQTGREPDMKMLWDDAIDLLNGRHKGLQRAEVARPLVVWWETQGRAVTKTVYSNKETERAIADVASPLAEC